MLKSILISFYFIFLLSASSKILQDEHEVHSSKTCSTKLINLYSGEGDDYGSQRSSFVPSELLKNSCTNFEDSCCLDEEFTMMTDISRKNLEHIYEGVQEAERAINMFSQLTTKKINEIIKNLGEKKIQELNLTKEEIQENLAYLNLERGDIAIDLENTYLMIEQYGAGLNCAICEASNHSNFSGINSQENIKLVFDYNYCYQLFNSEYFLSTLDFVRHMKPIMTLTNILAGYYNVPTIDHFRQSVEKVEQIDTARVSCLASVDDFSDDEQCAEMCIELGKPNQFFFKDIIAPLTSFVVIVTDYFGTQELLKANSSENTELEKEESVVTPEETIRAFVDQWDVQYILPPTDEYSPINLNRMKVELSYDKGWNFHEIRNKSWGIVRESVQLIQNIALMILGLNLIF
jgi:hypothetical protein